MFRLHERPKKSGRSSGLGIQRFNRRANYAIRQLGTRSLTDRRRRAAAGRGRGAPTPSRPSAERGGLDGVCRRLSETSASMVICAAGLFAGRLCSLVDAGSQSQVPLARFDRASCCRPTSIRIPTTFASSRGPAPPSLFGRVHSLATGAASHLSPPHPCSFLRRRLACSFLPVVLALRAVSTAPSLVNSSKARRCTRWSQGDHTQCLSPGLLPLLAVAP